MIRTRTRQRAVTPWQYLYKADATDPTLILQLDKRRFAANNAIYPFTDVLTLTRASSKWVFNSSGVLAEVSSNQPAYEHDPVTGAAKGVLSALESKLAALHDALGPVVSGVV